MKSKIHQFKGSYVSYVFVYFFFFFALAAFSSVLPVYLTGIGKSASEMSFIISAPSMFSLAIVPLVGYLCDRSGHPRLISGILMVMVGICALAFSQTHEKWLLFLLDGVVMSFIGSTMPICERLAGACKYRYGVLRVWGTLGYAVGAQVAGTALQNFPPFWLFFMVLVAAGLSILGFAEAENPILPDKTPVAPKKHVKVSSILTNRQFLLYLAAALVFSSCSSVNMTYSPVLLSTLGVATGAVGTIISLGTLVEIPLILFSNKFMDRFSGKTLFLCACTIALTQYLFYGLINHAWPVAIAMILLKAIASTLYAMLNLKMVRNLIDAQMTTTGLSILSATSSLGAIALQNIGGWFVDNFGIHMFYIVMASLIVLTMILLLPLRVKNSEKVFS